MRRRRGSIKAIHQPPGPAGAQSAGMSQAGGTQLPGGWAAAQHSAALSKSQKWRMFEHLHKEGGSDKQLFDFLNSF